MKIFNSKNVRSLINACFKYGGLKGLTLFTRLKTGVGHKFNFSPLHQEVHLRPKSSDIPTFIEIFIDEEYDFKVPFTPTVIVDGGANIGLSTLYFKNKFPASRVISIEPDAKNFEMLTKNAGHFKDVTLINGALWHSKSVVSVSDKYHMGEWGMVTEEVDGSTSHDVISTVTIDEIMERHNLNHIDILKLDIETAEKELFSCNFSNWLQKTKIVVIELHDWVSKGCSKPFFEAINKSFKNYSYTTIHENTIIYNEDFIALNR
jgi:FkbM family methyltransferase